MKRVILVLVLTLVATVCAAQTESAVQTQDEVSDAAGQSVAIDLTLALSLLAFVASAAAWWVRREVLANEAAHREFRDDIKKLLSGDVAWLKAMLEK